MKKLSLCIALVLAVSLAFAGCSQKDKEQSGVRGEGSPATPGAGNSLPEEPSQGEESPESESGDSSGEASTDSLMVADAPMYRGVVTEISHNGDYYEMTLESAEGTNFMYPTITMHTSDDTKASFDFEQTAVGDYLEVYYGDRTDGVPPYIIAANKLPPAEDCIFNGEVVEYDKEGGKLTLKSMAGENTVVFNFDDSTQFYMDTDKITAGAQLNVYHRGAMTRSLPPQGFAYEVRPFHSNTVKAN